MKMAAAARQREMRSRGMELFSLSSSYYLLYYISNKVEDKLGWKKREEEDGE